jgi:hypothetical protein
MYRYILKRLKFHDDCQTTAAWKVIFNARKSPILVQNKNQNQRTTPMSIPAKKKSKVTVTVTEDEMKRLGGEMMGQDPEGRSESIFLRRWLSFFGVEPIVCAETWNTLKIAVNDPDDPELENSRPEHLLWALLFLKKYGSEADMAHIAGGDSVVDEKTFRKWQYLCDSNCRSNL